MVLDGAASKRLLILCTTTGYQSHAFVEAAGKAGLQVVFGSDRCHVLADPWRDGAIPLRFEDPDESARRIAEYARRMAVDALVALGDRPAPAAARACRLLGLPGHAPEAADICRDKYRSRARLAEAGLQVPGFARFRVEDDPREIVASGTIGGSAAGSLGAAGVGFPCVVKPLALSASRGVIRANGPKEFIGAFERIRRLLRSPHVGVMREATSGFIQVETYVDGAECAVEAIVDRGRLRLLAVFDKPDPLTGPFFEETIYVTPSRLPSEIETAVTRTLEQSVRALGLGHGPVHAEFRINSEGVWVLELASRAIGGLCSRALRFLSQVSGEELSLEEVLIRLALGLDLEDLRREKQASGVMMIPVPGEGILKGVEGLEEVLKVAGVEDVVMTVKLGERLVLLPEGSSYPGFIFARSDSPERVEAALRRAHQKLSFTLAPVLPVIGKW